MDSKIQIREKLNAAYQRLAPLEQILMQLCSIIYEPTDQVSLMKCLRRTGLTLPGGGAVSTADISSCLIRLQALRLLSKSLQCHEAFVEECSRNAVKTVVDPKTDLQAGIPPAAHEFSKRKPGKSSTVHRKLTVSLSPTNRFQVMARAVQEEIPPVRYYGSGTASAYCQRAMRDLRIGLYTDDRDLLYKSYHQLLTHCSKSFTHPGPLVRICMNPFDAPWFRTLSTPTQTDVLTEIFYHTLFYVDPDDDALAYALDPQTRKLIPVSKNPGFYHHLITRLLIGGRLSEAARLLEEISGRFLLYGLEGWLQFLKGDSEGAVASFEGDLKKLRQNMGRRNAFFGGLEGLFCILARLQSEKLQLSDKTRNFLDAALARHPDDSPLRSSYQALKAIVHSLNGESRDARESLGAAGPAGVGLKGFFRVLASYWIEGRLTQEEIDTLSTLFIRSREAGLDWFSLEGAQLLCFAEDPTPVRRNAIEKVLQETGITSFAATIKVEEPWRKSLRALNEIAQGGQETPPARDSRVIWLLDYRNGILSVQPLEQKRNARGSWTKGRPVALSRLFGAKKPESLTSQDQAICATIVREGRYYYNTHYRFDTGVLLPALVGHPLLFLEKSPGTPVEVVKGEPELLVTREETELLIRFSMEIPDSSVFLVQESPTRFKVVQLNEHHVRISKILGGKGLKVPASAAGDVMDAVANLSSRVTVHSAIGGISRDLQEVAADSIPRVHILPSGSGLRFEMFVQPFGTCGPYLKPGSGMENVLAEIDGKLVHTKRDLKLEEELAESVDAVFPASTDMAAAEHRQWRIDDLHDCLQLLLDLKPFQDEGRLILAWPEGERLNVSREVSFDALHMRIRSKTNWFEVVGELRVDDGLVLDMRRLLELVENETTRFLPLGEGRFVTLTRELRKRLEELADYSETGAKGLKVHPLAAIAIEDFTQQLPRLTADQGWKARLDEIHSALQLKPTLPTTLKAELRDYQMEGYQWLARLAHLGLGACLADDMGLGKTLQALALILQRAPEGPALVVAPTSVAMNWIAEAHRFAPTLNLVVLGSGNRRKVVERLGALDVLIVSYGLLYQEAELLASITWHTIVLDEAQAIKNVAAKRSQAAMNLAGNMRLITTGTPIENHLGELWTLFNFINPGFLGSQERFNTRFAVPIERNGSREARKRLKKLIQPFILRRTKAQVLEELPPRTEVVLQVAMSAEEAAFYEALRRQALERIEQDDSPAGQKHLKILAEIMRLRQACCHPRLVAPGSTLSSSKLELFAEVISELRENRHKALVFSQFVGHLKLIREYLDTNNFDYRYLDGSTPPRERKREVDAFQAGWGDLFLISLKAGGLGLNLTAADYVIHMDPWWNPAVEDQASDRAHRIGQHRPVTVYRLVVQNSIEERIVTLHQEKRDLASSLLDGSDMVGRMSAEELLRLIREQ